MKPNKTENRIDRAMLVATVADNLPVTAFNDLPMIMQAINDTEEAFRKDGWICKDFDQDSTVFAIQCRMMDRHGCSMTGPPECNAADNMHWQTVNGVGIASENKQDVEYAAKAIRFYAELVACLESWLEGDNSEESLLEARLLKLAIIRFTRANPAEPTLTADQWRAIGVTKIEGKIV